MTWRRSPTLLVFCAALGTACGGTASYVPQEHGRIHFVKSEGKVMLSRDGKLFSMSAWSNAPIEAVAGVPAAEAQARSYHRQTWTSLIVAAVGGALIVPAVALGTNEPGHSGRRAASVGFGTAAMAALVTAMILPLQARHHLYDAVNIYNDELTLRKPGASPDMPPAMTKPKADVPDEHPLAGAVR
jgi:hypothetical protein